MIDDNQTPSASEFGTGFNQQSNRRQDRDGIHVLFGTEKGNTQEQADRLLDRLLSYRVFPDKEDRMNLFLVELNQGLLLVPQFTLFADTKKGMRPGFSSAAAPALGKELFEYLLSYARQK